MLLSLLIAIQACAFELFGSISFREPKITPNPYDWEVRLGARGKSYSFLYLKERENGKVYFGRDLSFSSRYRSIKWEFQETIRTAKKLNAQRTSIYYMWKGFGLGVTHSWKRWKDPRILASARYEKAIGRLSFKVDYSDNFTDRRIVNGEVRYKVPLWKALGVDVFALYRYITGKKWWQVKAEAAYTPEGLWGKFLEWVIGKLVKGGL